MKGALPNRVERLFTVMQASAGAASAASVFLVDLRQVVRYNA